MVVAVDVDRLPGEQHFRFGAAADLPQPVFLGGVDCAVDSGVDGDEVERAGTDPVVGRYARACRFWPVCSYEPMPRASRGRGAERVVLGPAAASPGTPLIGLSGSLASSHRRSTSPARLNKDRRRWAALRSAAEVGHEAAQAVIPVVVAWQRVDGPGIVAVGPGRACRRIPQFRRLGR
jgi:hypothetical protein